jgi:hypothetical protein
MHEAHRRRVTPGGAAFLAFFAVYAALAVVWLLGGLAPALVAAAPAWRESLGAAAAVSTPARALLLASYELVASAQIVTQYLFSALNLAMAAVLLRARPWDRAARLLAVAMVGTAASFNLQAHSAFVWLPVPELAILIVHDLLHIIAGVCYVYALLMFPDGRLVPAHSPPWWMRGPMKWVYLGAPVVVGAFSALLTDGDPLGLALYFGVFIPVVGVAAQLFRYRRAAEGASRQQSRLLLWTLGLAFGLALLFAGAELVLHAPRIGMSWETRGALLEVVQLAIPSLFTVIPVMLFAVIVRYRLWDIDVVINRTLVYGALTAALALVYLGSIIVLQYGFRAVTGQRSSVAVVLSTLAIAALFQPVRRRLQEFVDRRFYRHKYDAARTLAAYAAAARDEVDLARLRDDLVAVVHATMRPEHVALWMPLHGGAGAAGPLATITPEAVRPAEPLRRDIL